MSSWAKIGLPVHAAVRAEVYHREYSRFAQLLIVLQCTFTGTQQADESTTSFRPCIFAQGHEVIEKPLKNSKTSIFQHGVIRLIFH